MIIVKNVLRFYAAMIEERKKMGIEFLSVYRLYQKQLSQPGNYLNDI
jgi:hypothetical protein